MYRCSPRVNTIGATGGCRDSPRRHRHFWSRRSCCNNESERRVTLIKEILAVEINSDNFEQFGQVYRYTFFTSLPFSHDIWRLYRGNTMEKVSQQTYAASFLKFLNSRRHDFVQELQLEINRGTPRYYIFRKEERTLNFHKITYHEQVTQCLASVQNSPW